MRIVRYALIIFCIILYSVPIYAIVSISDREKKSYEEDVHFEFEKTAYGEPVKLKKKNIHEYYVVDGIISCFNVHSLNVNPEATIKAEVGDEIHVGDVLATYGYSSTVSEFNGIIEDINYGENIVIEYYDFSDLVFEVELPFDKYTLVDSKKFQDENGENIGVIEKSNIIENDKFKLVLSVPKDIDAVYGLNINQYKIYTGVKYTGVLVAEKGCVYKKDDKYCIRVVDDHGVFISEEEVKIGFESDEYVCVSSDNIDENTYCDSGYAMLENSETGDELNGRSEDN